jgi:hypothetical protein
LYIQVQAAHPGIKPSHGGQQSGVHTCKTQRLSLSVRPKAHCSC